MSRKTETQAILTAATATGSGAAFQPWNSETTFHCYGTTSAGTGAATIKIEVSNIAVPSVDGHWIEMASCALVLGTTVTSCGTSKIVPWKHLRARVSAISGTGASVNVIMGNLA